MEAGAGIQAWSEKEASFGNDAPFVPPIDAVAPTLPTWFGRLVEQVCTRYAPGKPVFKSEPDRDPLF